MIVFTAFEYVVAVVLESILGLRWWDYSDEVLNIQGRISLPYSISWRVLGVVFVEKMHPFMRSKIDRYRVLICKKTQNIVLNSMIIITLIDFILSIVKYVKM